MTRIFSYTILFVAMSVCLTTMAVMAEESTQAPATQPETAPQMPEGHTTLPSGHPEIPQGHPPMPKAQGQLPQGHPPIAMPEPKVYETTEVEPDWHIAVRHLIVRPMEDQLHVTEVWAVFNPTEKSYIGKPVQEVAEVMVGSEDAPQDQAPQTQPQASHEKGRAVLALPLPGKASHVQPGRGFEACCTRVEEGKLISTSPMTPGTNELHLNYRLAAEDGVFELPLTAPALTKHMMVFLPDDGSVVTAKGLTAGDPFQAGDKQFRMYMGKEVEKNTELGLTIKSDQAIAKPASMTASGAVAPVDNASQIKMVAGIGGGALLLAAVIVLLKPSKKQLTTGTAA